MDLEIGTSVDYLTWKDFRFGSDSITASFRYHRYRYMLDQLSEALPDYRAFMENYIRKCYTIGGTIIFPKHRSSMNQDRGTNRFICDRWDLTLECIRRYYRDEPSPLEKTLQSDHAFFSLFVDFKGYIDYFLLQDCVTPDYASVVFWLGDGTFRTNPLPETVDEYMLWIDKQLEFVGRRNARIAAAQP